MKLVIEGFAGAGCITMGGYDYHGGMRQEGEAQGRARGPVHGRVPRVRRAQGRAADDVRVQRRLAVEQRRDRQLRSPAAARASGRATTRTRRPRSSSSTTRAGRPTIFTGSDGLTAAQHQQLGAFRAGRQRRARGHAGREQREPARRDGAAQLHGAARSSKGNSRRAFPNHGLGQQHESRPARRRSRRS